MSRDREELVWVDKEYAEKLKKLITEKATREQHVQVFDEYIAKVNGTIRRDFEANLESIEEDAAIFVGLMLKTRQAFEKAKSEQLLATEEIWEKFEKEIPSIRTKTQTIIDTLKPLEAELKTLNDLLGKISTYNIDKLITSISNLSNACGTNKQMIEFLVTNFGKE
jgi:hypothetical protein